MFILEAPGRVKHEPVRFDEEGPTVRDQRSSHDDERQEGATNAKRREAWRDRNDTVKGGNGRVRIERTEDGLVVAGDLVARGGGFVPLQARLPDGALAGMTGLRLVASGDGRPRRVRIATDTRVPRDAPFRLVVRRIEVCR